MYHLFNHLVGAGRVYNAVQVQQEALTEEEVALLQPAGPVQLHLQPRPDQVLQ